MGKNDTSKSGDSEVRRNQQRTSKEIDLTRRLAEAATQDKKSNIQGHQELDQQHNQHHSDRRMTTRAADNTSKSGDSGAKPNKPQIHKQYDLTRRLAEKAAQDQKSNIQGRQELARANDNTSKDTAEPNHVPQHERTGMPLNIWDSIRNDTQNKSNTEGKRRPPDKLAKMHLSILDSRHKKMQNKSNIGEERKPQNIWNSIRKDTQG